jgi:hypothetical protein
LTSLSDTIIALTGGLAAPLLAPFLVGLTGATFFATAGGIALVTSLFGLTGKNKKRTFRHDLGGLNYSLHPCIR